MKKNQTTTWLVLAIGAGLLLFAFSSAAAGALTITVAAGLMAGIKTPTSGRVILQLPGGATWVSGEASTGTLTPQALPLPNIVDGPWSLNVTAGMSLGLVWNDATGTQFRTFLTFA
jgi:hypothetical protein